MKINLTNHAIEQVIKRIGKIDSKLKAIDYVKEKFSGMYKKKFYKFRRVFTGKGDKDTFYISNGFHRIIYTFLESGEILIITYMKITQNVKKKTKIQRILEIIFE